MRTTEHATIIVERDYQHPPAKVFAAWADPRAKRAWFAEGEGWEIQNFALDFREGGGESSKFRFVKSDDAAGEEPWFGNETVFDEIAPNQRIIFTYAMDRNGARFSVSLACAEFKPAGAGTRLILTEHAAFFEGGDGAAMREAGWRELLDKLGDHLAGAATALLGRLEDEPDPARQAARCLHLGQHQPGRPRPPGLLTGGFGLGHRLFHSCSLHAPRPHSARCPRRVRAARPRCHA